MAVTQSVDAVGEDGVMRLEECAGIARRGEAICFGVPFAAGEWPAAVPMGLASSCVRGRGGAVSCAWRITQRWADGSVRLAFCTAEIELDARGILELAPSSQALLPPPVPRPQAQWRGISCVVSLDGEVCEQPLRWRAPAAATGAGTHAVDSAPDSAAAGDLVTPRGQPSVAVVGAEAQAAGSGFMVLEGGMVAASGEPMVAAETTDAGTSELLTVALEPLGPDGGDVTISGAWQALSGGDGRCVLTISNGGTADVEVEMLRIVVDGTGLLGGACRAQLGSGGGAARLEEEERPSFVQLSRLGRLRAASRDDEEIQYPLGGECRQNLFWGRVYNDQRGAALVMRNMGENFPCALSLGAGRIHLDLWPREAGPMVLKGGMAKTYEFGIVFDDGGARNTDMSWLQGVHHPLAVQVPTARLERLGCFGTLGPYLPRQFPKLESWIQWILANRPRAYGWKHFGDEPAFGYMPRARDPEELMFLNNEYDFPLIALGQFCRTGGKIAYEDGRAAVLHMMDIDTVGAAEDPLKVGGQYSHSPQHTTHPPAPDHEWLEGLLLWHVLSGDPRALARARALAERLLRLTESGLFDQPGMTSRRYGWPLIALSSFHAFSGERRYLDAAARIVEGMRKVEEEAGSLRSPYWGLPYWSLDTFMLGIATAGLCRYHALTQCAATREMILRACDAMRSLASPEGILPYKEYPLVRVNEPVSTTITLEALAYGFQLSGERAYLALGARNLEHTFDMLRGGSVLEWNAEQRVSFADGAYMRARTVEMNAQLIGLLLRGIWPFLATAAKAGIFAGNRNPFGFAADAWEQG